MTDKLNLIETIAGDDKLSAFARMMKSSTANEIFSGEGPFTVFAPTNDAFGKMPDAKMNALLQEENQTSLRELLAYHVVSGRLTAAKISGLPGAATMTGVFVSFSDNYGLKVNSSGIQARNIEATDGVLHSIDTVLAPPAAAAALSR
jgi:uncharacterized surface protein with fasciclin (FAS1) repeats